MKTSRFNEGQIIGILKEQEAGGATADVCRKHGISPAFGWIDTIRRAPGHTANSGLPQPLRDI